MMKSSRRSFLSAAAAAFVMDPERLLWVKGAKVYSLPPKPTTLTFGPITLTNHSIHRVCSLTVNGHVIPVDDFFIYPGDKISVSFPDTGRVVLELARVTIDRDFKMFVQLKSPAAGGIAYGYDFASD